MTNAIRSLSRAVAATLGDEWEIRWDATELFDRPYARVVAASPLASTPVGNFARELRQSFDVIAYPEPRSVPGVPVALTPQTMNAETARVQSLLLEAFTAGRYPMSVDLYDYTGVAPGLAAATDRIGVMKVTDPPSFEMLPEDESDLLVLVCGLRVRWVERVRPAPVGEVAETVGARKVA
jgi:hypothetical protein